MKPKKCEFCGHCEFIYKHKIGTYVCINCNMKVEKNHKQITLFKKQKEQKKENLKTITKITDDPTPNDLTMSYYLCTTHNIFFWRNIKRNEGLCPFCKEDELTNLMDHHIIDKELSDEVLRIVEQKIDEKIRGWNNMKVEPSVKIDDGKYNGKIVDVEERTEPFEYTDFQIEFDIDDRKIKLPFGCPSNILVDEKTNEPTSKLATTLNDFGFEMKLGEDITIPQLKEHFTGMKVISLISNKKGKTGTFATVMTMTPDKK